jgi:hypothetical protein
MSEDLTKKQSQTDSEKLNLILTGVQGLTSRVESADSLRPLLHKVVDDVSQLREGQIEIRAEVLKLEEGQRALGSEFRAMRRDVDHRFNLLYDKLLEINVDRSDLHNRVSRLELGQNPPNTQT